MLTPDESSVDSLQRPVEIYENQRFWIGAGFSSKGLFPTERGAFSTHDGSISWRTVEEAALSMLGRGWEYDTDGFVVETSNVTTEKGWSYASDFSPRALRSCSKEKRMTDTVRRRKYVRMKRFNPKLFFPSSETYAQCRYCDSAAVETLSSKLLETLSLATLFEKSLEQDVTDAVAFRLKEELMDLLSADWPGIEESKEKDADNSGLTRISTLNNQLDQFANNHQTVLSKASHVLDKSKHEQLLKDLPARSMVVTFRYLGKEERDAIAGLVIRNIDPEFQLHCNRENCGEECVFFVVSCSNQGCDKKLSRKYLDAHNEVCGYREIDCPLGCGDVFTRNKQDIHLATVCGLRNVKCPFHKLGCTEICKAKEVNQHVQEMSSSHLLLAMNRMMEYESVMNKLNGKIDGLERENKTLQQQLSVQNEVLTKELGNLNARMSDSSTKLTDLETSCLKKIRKIEDAIAPREKLK